jgi:hypothetical protein
MHGSAKQRTFDDGEALRHLGSGSRAETTRHAHGASWQ